MQYIVKYKSINEPTICSLNEAINTLINEGWQPHGGVATPPTGLNGSYAQAMVKYTQPAAVPGGDTAVRPAAWAEQNAHSGEE